VADFHSWNKSDDVVALYLYRFGDDGLPLSIDEIGERLGMGAGALRMRLSNVTFVDGGNGLCHPAHQTRQVYAEHIGCTGLARPEDILNWGAR